MGVCLLAVGALSAEARAADGAMAAIWEGLLDDHLVTALIMAGLLLILLAVCLVTLRINARLRSALRERQQAAEALRRSESSLALAQRVAHVGSWNWEIGPDVITWSDMAFSIFGLDRDEFEVTYDSFFERVHPGDRGRVEDAVRAALSGKAPYDVQHRILRGDGQIRFVRERGFVTRDRDGEPIRMIGTVQDITERQIGHMQLAAIARFPAENPNPVLRITRDGEVLYANDAAAELNVFGVLRKGHCEDPNWMGVIRDAMNSGRTTRVEITTAGRHYALSIAPMPEEGHVNIYAMDVTERRAAERWVGLGVGL